MSSTESPQAAEATFKRVLYMKAGCPFCTKLAVFMAESKSLELVDIKDDSDENRAYLEEHSGKKPTFPAVELSPKEIMYETDDIIAMFAKEVGADPENMVAFKFFDKFKADYSKLVRHIGFPHVFEQIADKRKEIPPQAPANDPSGPGLESSTMEKPKVYVKPGCPFSTKFIVFLADAQLLDKVTVEFDTDENRAYLEKCTGKKPTFPALEVDTEKVKYETQDLIEMCARVHNIDPAQLYAYNFYTNGLFINFRALVKILGHDTVVQVLTAEA